MTVTNVVTAYGFSIAPAPNQVMTTFNFFFLYHAITNEVKVKDEEHTDPGGGIFWGWG